MYLGALGILDFLGLELWSGCGMREGVVLADVDKVEDTFEPGLIGSLELLGLLIEPDGEQPELELDP